MNKPVNLETFGGDHLRDVLVKAVAMATRREEAVAFVFNGKTYTVQADDTFESAKARAERAFGHAITTREQDAERARVELERSIRESAAAIAAAGVPTEKELRESDVPWPKTIEDLSAYIQTQVNRPHDYGTSVYAMSLAATAAFRYVAGVLGTTGFQASCADLDILRRTRDLKGPFLILKAEDALYPQYDLRKKLDDALESWRPWLADEAAKRLKERGEAHSDVAAHWRMLSAKVREREEQT